MLVAVIIALIWTVAGVVLALQRQKDDSDVAVAIIAWSSVAFWLIAVPICPSARRLVWAFWGGIHNISEEEDE